VPLKKKLTSYKTTFQIFLIIKAKSP